MALRFHHRRGVIATSEVSVTNLDDGYYCAVYRQLRGGSHVHVFSPNGELLGRVLPIMTTFCMSDPALICARRRSRRMAGNSAGSASALNGSVATGAYCIEVARRLRRITAAMTLTARL